MQSWMSHQLHLHHTSLLLDLCEPKEFIAMSQSYSQLFNNETATRLQFYWYLLHRRTHSYDQLDHSCDYMYVCNFITSEIKGILG